MHPDNSILSNPKVTPSHIVPEWYFLPFYAMLRAISDKLLGVLCMFFAIIILLFLPYFTRKLRISCATFRPFYTVLIIDFYFNFIGLGWLGGCLAEYPFVTLSRLFTISYFLFFVFIFFFIEFIERLAFLFVFRKNKLFKKRIPLSRATFVQLGAYLDKLFFSRDRKQIFHIYKRRKSQLLYKIKLFIPNK